MPRRSQLYVPGNNEKMVKKSITLDCDSVILDLEDSIPDGEKDSARDRVAKWASEEDWGKKELCVRINSASTPWGRADIERLKSIERINAIVVPKSEGDLSLVHEKTGKMLIPIIETGKGLLGIEKVAQSNGVDALAYGAADFANSVGGTIKAYLDNPYVKTKLAVVATALGIDPINNVFFDLVDSKGFRLQAGRARDLGFVGAQVIHPSQILPANKIFTTNRQETEWATKVMEEYETARKIGRGAISVDGQLVDEVHYKIAKRVIERSEP